MAAALDYTAMFKTLVVGDEAVGKTSLAAQFLRSEFSDTYAPTLGINFFIQLVQVDDCRAKLQIWDASGHARFRTVTAAHYRGAAGAIIVFDVTNRDSFDSVKDWAALVSDRAGTDTPCILVGNKVDLGKRIVTEEDAKNVAANLRIPYFETSAKLDSGVTDIFNGITKKMLAQRFPDLCNNPTNNSDDA